MAVAIAVVLSFGLQREAHAKGKVEIVSVDLAGSAEAGKQRSSYVTRMVRRFAQQSAKHLDFGKTRRAQLTFLVKELKIEETDGLVRVTCTLVGTLKGGGSAKSRLSFAGKPTRKKQIEREVIASVTDGVMIRLAEMSRARP